MKINVEVDRIRIEVDGDTVIHLTREGARDLQEQLDDILGLIESVPGPVTIQAPEPESYTFTWDSGTVFDLANI